MSKIVTSVHSVYEDKESLHKILHKLEWIHCAIQEALNGNLGELPRALEMVEDIREPYLKDWEYLYGNGE